MAIEFGPVAAYVFVPQCLFLFANLGIGKIREGIA